MREFLLNSKWKIIRVVLLLTVFLIVVAYINGKSVYEERMQQLKQAEQVFKA